MKKKSKTIYTDLKYNRHMTDDRNRKSGNPVSKKILNLVIIIIVTKHQCIIIGV